MQSPMRSSLLHAAGHVKNSFFPSVSFFKLAEPMLPYALAFAAGAMIYVVVDDIVPEAQTR